MLVQKREEFFLRYSASKIVTYICQPIWIGIKKRKEMLVNANAIIVINMSSFYLKWNKFFIIYTIVSNRTENLVY